MNEILTTFDIKKQGAPKINSCIIIKQTKNIICLQIDLESKYCTIEAFYSENGVIYLSIEASSSSVGLHRNFKRSESTLIIFDQFPKFKIFATSVMGKYTINLVLIKDKV